MARRNIVVIVALVFAAVGAVDAALGEVWDLFVGFVVIGCLLTGILLAGLSSRSPVTLRRDLHRGLERRARTEGEALDTLLDRAVAFELSLRERSSWTPHRD